MTSPVVWILICVAIIAVFVFFDRFFELRRAHIDWQAFVKGVKNVLDNGNIDEALAICDDTGVPVASLMANAIRYRSLSPNALRENVDAQGRIEIGKLDRRLASLSIIAQTTPLLGLLGTIIGFAKTILLLNTEAVVSRAALMNCAMEALVPAALGLAISIPVLIMHRTLKIRMDRCVTELESAATIIINDISEISK